MIYALMGYVHAAVERAGAGDSRSSLVSEDRGRSSTSA